MRSSGYVSHESMTDGTSKPPARHSNARFATTHWSIVLAAFKNFLADEHDRAKALKRGIGQLPPAKKLNYRSPIEFENGYLQPPARLR